MKRKIIHIDMDAFYASIEQNDDRTLKGKPIVVGGSPKGRGVVCTCSYEARKYGIHSAMSCREAYKRCPYAIFIRPRFDRYKEISSIIRNIFHKYTDIVEPLSLDEAFLDVTNNKLDIEDHVIIAKMIKDEIKLRTGLTASAGVSYNKFIAKIASDYRKPNGMTVITEENSQEFLDRLPVKKFFGVGRVTERVLKNHGIDTGYDLRMTSLDELEKIFGNRGYELYNLSRGVDNRPVEAERTRKSISSETTLDNNMYIDDVETIGILDELCEDVTLRMKKESKAAKTVTLKVKFSNFRTITRSMSLDKYIYENEKIRFCIGELINNIEDTSDSIRLFGVSVSNLIDVEDIEEEITLFDYIK